MIATTAPSDLAPVTWDDVLSPHVYVFYASFIVAFLFTPVMRSIAIYYGVIDQPDSVRKLHSAPVAYLGGVAVFMGWVAGLAMSQLHIPADSIGSPHLEVKLSIVFGAAVIVILGLWDDIKRIAPSNKIIGQAIAGMILLKGGVGTDFLGPIASPINIRLHNVFGPGVGIPESATLFVSWALVVCIVVFCCNATNLLDGLDGLCGGVTAQIAAGFLFLAVVLATKQLDPSWDPVRIVLALALLGAILGFVPYNFNPASIFMGDTGSMFLGYSCATLIVLLGQEQSKWFLAAMVMFALPILDTALAFIRRWVNKRPIFSADKHHFHHQMMARGLSIKMTVLISYALTIGFCLLGALITFMRTRYAIAFYLVIFGSIIVAAYKMGLVHEKVLIVTPKPLGNSNAVSPPLNPDKVVDVVLKPKPPLLPPDSHPTGIQPDPA